MESQVVLVTGCSSGIGRDLVCRLAAIGYRVVATARRPESLRNLQASLALPLDVQDPVSVTNAVEQVIATFGRIDVLVNNAGYSQIGAVEEVSDAELQQVFDVNLYGAMRLVRAVLPQMRRQRSGRIIQVSSIAGRVAMPLSGAYSATKFALEAMSDALRLELLPFGIEVVLVEPAAIHTGFEEALRTRAAALIGNPDSPYRRQYAVRDQVSAMLHAKSPGPEIVSAAIERVIAAGNHKARYSMPVGQALQIQVLRLLPDSLKDHLVASLFGIKGPNGRGTTKMARAGERPC